MPAYSSPASQHLILPVEHGTISVSHLFRNQVVLLECTVRTPADLSAVSVLKKFDRGCNACKTNCRELPLSTTPPKSNLVRIRFRSYWRRVHHAPCGCRARDLQHTNETKWAGRLRSREVNCCSDATIKVTGANLHRPCAAKPGRA